MSDPVPVSAGSDRPSSIAVVPTAAADAPPATPPAASPAPSAAGRPDAMGRGFWALLWAMFVANLGSGITFVAFPWLTTELTRDPLLIAGAVMAAELPWLLFSLPVGVWVDRYEHRRLISSSHVGRAVVVGLLALAVLTDVTSLWMIYVVGFAVGSLTVMNENASQTILPRLVRPAQINRANSHLMLADTVGGMFLGPAIGGWLLLVSVTLPFALDAGLYLLAAGLVMLVTARASGAAGGAVPVADASSTTTRPGTLRTEMAAGLRFFWENRVLRQLGIFLGLLNLASAVIVGTQVLFAREILELDSAEFGMLFAVGAVGAAIGSGIAPGLEDRYGPRRVLLGTLVGNVAVSLSIGLTSSALVVGAALLVAGALAVVWNVVTISYRQRIVPGHMLGRVNSVYRLLAWGPLAAGSLISGALVKAGIPVFGREPALRLPLFVAAALAAVLTAYAVLRLRDGIWSRDPAAVYPDADGGEAGGATAAGLTLPAFGGSGGTRRPVLPALIGVNVLVAVIGLVLIARDNGLSVDDAIWDGVSSLQVAGEMSGAAVDRGEVWRLVTAMFIHYGLAHLAVNLLMLFLAGRRLEPILGWPRFLQLYLLCGLGAGVATYLFSHDSLTAGASGANFGVFAALLTAELRLRRNPVLAVVLVLFGVVTTFAIPGMAVAAHAAGLLVGVVVALGFALPTGERRARVQRAVPVVALLVLLLTAAVAIVL